MSQPIKNSSLLKIILLIGVFLLISIVVQYNSFMNRDVLNSMRMGINLIHGGNFYKDVFDNNPPLVFYLMGSLGLLAKQLGIGQVIFLRVIFYVFSLLSLWVSYFLLSRLQANKKAINNLIIIALAYCYLVLPGRDFGEREYITLLLSVPYFLLVLCFINSVRINTGLRIILSLFALLGFALKPYFLFPLVFSELYAMAVKRQWFTWLRLETLLVGFGLIFYLLAIYWVAPTYLTKMLPYVLRYYAAVNYLPWSVLLTTWEMLYFYILVVLLIFYYRSLSEKQLVNFLLIIAVGFCLSFLVQAKGFFYHAFPFVSLLTVVYLLLIYELFKKINIGKHFIFYCIGFMLTVFLFLYCNYLFTYAQTVRAVITYRWSGSLPNRMIKFVDAHQKYQPIYFLSSLVEAPAITVYYTHTKLASANISLWMAPYLYVSQYNKSLAQSRVVAVNLVRNQVVADFRKHQPKMVFVTHGAGNHYDFKFKFLKFFLADPRFKSIWSCYQFSKQIEFYSVYLRKPNCNE